MFKVGLVGTGVMGQTHSAAYKQIAGATITAVCDVIEPKARELAGTWGAEIYSSLEDMLAQSDLDAVDICIPTDLHRGAVEQAAAAGKHVFCEKPIAPTADDAEAMIAACRQAGVTFMVGHVVRFFPEYRAARDLIASGGIGKPAVIRTIRSGQFPVWMGWYADYRRSGGPLLDLAIHDFDFLRWCLGPVTRVYSRTLSERHDTLDHTLTLLRFESGAMAHVEASWAYPQGAPFQTSLEAAGTEGLIQFDNEKSVPIIRFGGDSQQNRVSESPLDKSPYALELEHFLHCIRSGETPLTSGEEALASLRVSLAAIDSSQTNQPVAPGGA